MVLGLELISSNPRTNSHYVDDKSENIKVNFNGKKANAESPIIRDNTMGNFLVKYNALNAGIFFQDVFQFADSITNRSRHLCLIRNLKFVIVSTLDGKNPPFAIDFGEGFNRSFGKIQPRTGD